MKKHINIINIVLLLCVSTSSVSVLAAKPVKITPGPKGVAVSGEKFRNYLVQCSNGKKYPLTAWKNGKQWCIGKESMGNCSKKQIKAAKGACKLG